MTTRELLRAAAGRIDCGAGTVSEEGCDMKPPCSEYAAALRAIADRFDAEMEYAKPGGQTYGMLKFHKEGALACLARLDAPVTK